MAKAKKAKPRAIRKPKAKAASGVRRKQMAMGGMNALDNVAVPGQPRRRRKNLGV